ncbi:hypothetical protein [Microbacterium aureliae]
MSGTRDVGRSGHHGRVEKTRDAETTDQFGHGHHHSPLYRKGKSTRLLCLFRHELTFPWTGLWSGVHPPANEGKRVVMARKSPTARDGKKVAQSTLKEKRAEKRASAENRAFIKPRKGASG